MSPAYKLGRLTRRRSDGSRYWSYCVMWWEPGCRVRRTLDTQDRPLAEAKARAIWSARNDNAVVHEQAVGIIVEAFLDGLNGLRDEKRRREAWAAAKGYWANITVDVIDASTSHSYMAWRKRSVNTMRTELSLIRTALNQRLGKTAPKVHVPGIPQSKVGHLTKPEFRAFLEGCISPHVKLFAILGVTTGARKTALLQAKWDQVNWERKQLDLNPAGRVQNTKGRAIVPLNDLAMEALREAKDGATTEYIIEYHCGPLKDIKRGITGAMARTGVRAHPHMFRHSAAVWMAEARVPMQEISAFLGHSNLNITSRIYARFNPEYLRGSAEALTW